MNTCLQLNQNLNKTLKKGRVKSFSLPLCPQIELYLFDPAVLEGPISHEEAQAVVAMPAYWSFCWASGQVLAQHLLNHPELVRGKTVIDFGSGSGVVAISSALAGAKHVIACDLDPDALAATHENARLNGVTIQLCKDFTQIIQSPEFERQSTVICAADVLYDRDNFSLLDTFTQCAKRVILADSRVKQLPSNDYEMITTVEARTWPDLNEFEEFNRVRIYYAQGNDL